MDERDQYNNGKISYTTQHETDQNSSSPHNRSNSFVAVINSGYNAASKEFEKFFTSWGFYKRPTDSEQQDKYHGKRKRDFDTDEGTGHKRINDNSAIYGRIIPDENRQHSLSPSIYNKYNNSYQEPSSASTEATSPPKKKQNNDVFQYLLQPHSPRESNGTTLPPQSSIISSAKCRDFDQQEQERIARLKRSIESLESKAASIFQYPKPTRTVRFSPVVEHASTAYKRARHSLSLEQPRQIPTGSNVGSSHLHENIIKDTPVDFRQAKSEEEVDTIDRLALEPSSTITESVDSSASLMGSFVKTPRKLNGGQQVLPSELPPPRSSLKTAGKEHKQSMALIIHQIPTVKLRRTDTIRGSDGQLIPNRFWNEIYNNGKNKSRPL